MKRKKLINLAILTIAAAGLYYLLFGFQLLTYFPTVRLNIYKYYGYHLFPTRIILLPINALIGDYSDKMYGLWTGSRSIEESKKTGAFIQCYETQEFVYSDETVTIRIPPLQAFVEYQQYYDGNEMRLGEIKNLMILIDRKGLKGRYYWEFADMYYHSKAYLSGKEWVLFRNVQPENHLELKVVPSKAYSQRNDSLNVFGALIADKKSIN